MKIKLLLVMSLLLAIAAASGHASVVGKITGTITDANTGEPIPGATISVEGTTMGAMAGLDGNYTILNVPVGDYTLRTSAIGYATVKLSGVHVSADLASYHDFEMVEETTELETVIEVQAERKLIIRDKTTTVNVVERDQIQAMPVRGFDQVVGIQNSVVRMNAGNFQQRQRGQRASVANNTELNLRGGRPAEVAYYVDGFSQQDPLTGISTANINTNAIKEVSVVTGGFSAEYGNVASGIVNVITNEGSDEYHGNVEVVSDQVLGDNFDQNYYSADLSGPIPGLDNAYFFVSGERRWLGDRTPSYATETMINTYGAAFGLDDLYENPQRLPQNTLSGWSYQGKILYELSPNFKIRLGGNGSVDDWREYRQEWLLNPDHGPRYEDKNLGLNAKITHLLNEDTYWNFSAAYYMTSRIRGDNAIFDDIDAYRRSYVWDDGEVDVLPNPEEDEFLMFWQSDSFLVTNQDTLGWDVTADTVIDGTDTTINVDSSLIIEEDSLKVDRDSYYPAFLKQKSSYVGLKGDITSQVNEQHTLKAGFDFQRHTLRYFRHLDVTQPYSTNLVNRFGYDENGEEADPGGYINNTKHPYNLGLYLQDRFEWRGMIVQAGLRFDVFDYQADRIKDFRDPFGGADGTLDEENLEDSEAFYRLSPRLGISFPVSDVTQMHINYGKFFQRPNLNNLYVGYDFFEARVNAGSYYPFPSPNLEPEKITQYEVGIAHELAPNIAFNITAYYKDVQDLTQIQHIGQTSEFITAYDVYGNIDFGTIKGADFGLTMRRTNHIMLDFRYSLSYATGTGSYANSTYLVNWGGVEPPKSTHSLDYDQRHNITVNGDLRFGKKEGPRLGRTYPLENFGINVLLFAASGTPYTPMELYDEVSEAALRPQPRQGINAARKPWLFNIDLKMERKFTLSNIDITPYLWIKNLLDRENVVAVYEGTGKPDVSGYLNTDAGQGNLETYGATYENRYLLKQYNASNWSNPRMIMFGTRVSF